MGQGDAAEELGEHGQHRVLPDPERERPEPGPGLLRRLRPRGLQDQPEPDSGLGPDLGHGQPDQLHQLRRPVRLLLALLGGDLRQRDHRRRVQRRLRQGRAQRPDRPAQRQELAHRGQRQAQHHPDHAEVTDAGGALRIHRGLRQHPAAKRAQHRQRQLAAYLPMVTSSHSRPGTPSPAGSTTPSSEPGGPRNATGRSVSRSRAMTPPQQTAIWNSKHRVGPYLLLLPATAIIGALILCPAVQIGLFSFQNYGLMQISGVLPAQWVGFSNYSQILHDPEFWVSLKTSVYFALVVVPLTMIVGTLVGQLLARLGPK